jgi:hypothetical protein
MRKFLIAIVALALLGGACRGEEKKITGDSPNGASEIRSKVLTVADLPPGYKRTSLDVDKKDEEDQSPSGCPQLDQVDKQYLNSTTHDVDAEFQNGEGETAQFVSESIEQYKSADFANTYFDAQVSAFNSCKSFDSTDPDGTHYSGTMSTFAIQSLGDDTFAVSVAITTQSEGEDISFAGPMIAVRKGDSVMTLFAFHVNNQPGLSTGEVTAIATKAAAKL